VLQHQVSSSLGPGALMLQEDGEEARWHGGWRRTRLVAANQDYVHNGKERERKSTDPVWAY